MLIPPWCRRVVFVALRYPDLSGGATSIRNFSSALRGRGIRVEVLSIYPGDNQAGADIEVVVARETLHRYPLLRQSQGALATIRGACKMPFKLADRHRFVRRLRKRLDDYGSDTVVLFTYAGAKEFVDNYASHLRESRACLIVQHHSSFQSLTFEPHLRESLVRACQDADVFVALSDADTSAFQEILPVPCMTATNMSAPLVDLGSGQTPTASPATAVAVTRLGIEKQLDFMVKAFARAASRPELKDWHLDIYGDGETRDDLADLISKLGMQNRVRLRGVTRDVGTAFRSAQVALLTSRYEGFPYSVLEAAQHGVPTIALDSSAGLHNLLNAVHGFGVPPSGGVDTFASAIEGALMNPLELARRGRLGQAGAALFAPQHVLEQWALVFERARLQRDARLARSR